MEECHRLMQDWMEHEAPKTGSLVQLITEKSETRVVVE